MEKLILPLLLIQALSAGPDVKAKKESFNKIDENAHSLPVVVKSVDHSASIVEPVENVADNRNGYGKGVSAFGGGVGGGIVGGYGGSASGYGGGSYGGGNGLGTALIVKGATCACHQCECEKGQINHCSSGVYGKGGGGYGKHYCYGEMEGEYCHCDYCKCKHGYGIQGYGGGCGGH